MRAEDTKGCIDPLKIVWDGHVPLENVIPRWLPGENDALGFGLFVGGSKTRRGIIARHFLCSRFDV